MSHNDAGSSIRLLKQFSPVGGTLQPGTPETRIAPANFGPGGSLVDGPNARTLSNVVSAQAGDIVENSGVSAWIYVMGQFVDHDLDLEAVGGSDISIPIPPGDPELTAASIAMTRAITDPTTGTVVNTVAGGLDLSQVYGSTAAVAESLRNKNGTMKTSAGNALPIVNGAFVAGDVRVMENPELVAVTTLFVREHNYWVGVLKSQHPNWSGDQLYNMAKAITTAEYQNIVYSEFLPAVVGNVIPAYHGFDPTVDTSITQEFSAAAFRVGHSQVSGEQEGIDNKGNLVFSQSLAEAFFNTPAQDIENGINALLRNVSADDSQAVDVYAVDELRNLLSASPAFMDLIAIDIQRERDLGLGTLNQTRTALGLTPYTSFDQLTSDPVVAANLESQFGSIDNVDLFLGGLAEDHAPGANVGETFGAIIADQFTRLRDGDQFFWQNEGFDKQTAQLISQTTLSDILSRNTNTPALQLNVFISQQRHASNVAAEDPTGPQLVIGIDKNGAKIAGGVADDTIVAGDAVHQTLTGGGGADVFQFIGSGHTGDVISDWDSSDVIAFQVTQGNKHASIDLMSVKGGTQVEYGGNSIFLAGVNVKTLSAGNFDLPPGETVRLSISRDHGHLGNPFT